MLSPRWLIGITLFMVFAFVLSNWIDGTAMFSATQASSLQTMTGHDVVSVTSSTGSVINYINIIPSALTAIGKALVWDYSFFHDIIIWQMCLNRRGYVSEVRFCSIM